MTPATNTDLESRRFRTAMARFATGVTVVTTQDADGVAHGFTANSFCSVSLDPPLVLVCLARVANSFPVFTWCDQFAVSVLRDHQAAFAERFATKRGDKFDVGTFGTTEGGLSVVGDALCVIECETEERHDAGDHIILIGLVHDVQVREGAPLVYFDRAFHRIDARI